MSTDMPASQAALLCLALGNEGPDAVIQMNRSRLIDGKVVHLARNMGLHTVQALLALGASFPKDDGSDNLLIPVQIPPGWSVKPTSHHMYSDLLDEQGRKRGVIGYKGAFWDRWAAFHLTCRYKTGHEYAQHLPKDQMPEKIAALQVTEKVARRVEIPEHERRRLVFSRWDPRDPWASRYGVYPRQEVEVEEADKYRIEYKMEEVNKFDPHRIKKHKSLPYLRYYIEDTSTGERLWTSIWYSVNQINQIERRKKVVYPSVKWLNQHFPKHNDVLAYW